jgi:AcrR family transcriptional regulator
VVRSGLSARKQPSQERSRQTVAVILDAAAQVFAERGYASATTAKVAARAGVSVGSLYQYFPNKDALLVALSERHVERSHAGIREVLNDEDLEGLSLEGLVRRLVAAMLELHLQEPDLHRLLFQEIPRQPAISKAKEESERALLRKLERLLRRHPEVRARDARLAAAIVGQTVESLTHWYVLEAPELGLAREAFAEEVTALVCAYLSGGGRPPGWGGPKE